MTLTLHMRKLRLRETRGHAPGATARPWQIQDVELHVPLCNGSPSEQKGIVSIGNPCLRQPSLGFLHSPQQ